VVQTRSQRVLDGRRAVLEFILLNHPVDCPICDQAGECDLQDLYYAHDRKPSRHAYRKHHKPKARTLGPQVIYDAERCINCTRCVRFCDEVSKSRELRQVQRGERTFIDVFPGRVLDNPYSMCTTDLCPVGALTPRDFRFKCRVWFLAGTDSVCAECSRGCAVRVDTYRNAVQRVVPRRDDAVNKWWACDAGRLAYHAYETGRVAAPRVRGTAVPYAAAVKALADDLAAVPAGAAVAVLLSASLACEDATAAVAFAGARWPGSSFAVLSRPSGPGDDLLVRTDRDSNRAGVGKALSDAGVTPVAPSAASGAAAVLVLGAAGADAEAVARAVGEARVSVAAAALDADVAGTPTHLFPATSPYETEGTFINEFGVIRTARRAVRPGIDTRQPGRVLADVAARAGSPLAMEARP
jgi:NADH-quinone oxidoreductase subunit G